MKRFLLLALMILAGMPLHAQKQEENMIERIHNPTMQASRMANREFSNQGAFQVREFGGKSFEGVKASKSGEFRSRSFFGIKNPWFGKKVFDTEKSLFADRAAREGKSEFSTSAFAVDAASGVDRSAAPDAILPDRMKPRTAVVAPKAQGSVDQFTGNLSKELSIDEVRALLNKGHQNR